MAKPPTKSTKKVMKESLGMYDAQTVQMTSIEPPRAMRRLAGTFNANWPPSGMMNVCMRMIEGRMS